GQRAVAVFDLSSNVRQLLVSLRRRDPLVGPQPLTHVVDVLFGNPNVDAQIHRSRKLVVDRLALQLANRSLEHLSVKVKADRIDVTRLLASEQIARPAQLEVERGDAKSRAEV